MMRRWRRLLFAGAGIFAVGVAALLALSAVTVEHAVAPTLQGGCYNVALDGGTLPTAPIDAGTEAGVRLYKITVTGNATIAPATLQVFDGDLARKISDQAISTAGAWSRDLVLELGWHKLIFRVVRGGRSWETVRWIGLATAAPTWSAPAWDTDLDGGAGCWDTGCVPAGQVPGCIGNRVRCSDGGCKDALHPVFKDPIGCVRGCGPLSALPDAGCRDAGCPGLTDAQSAYRPLCCPVGANAAGLVRTPAYSVSVAGLASEIAAQVTAGSKVTVASSASGDKSHLIGVFGVAADGFFRNEGISTNGSNGTTPVTGTIKWNTILGARDLNTPAGTITMTSTTGGQTILTLTAAARTKGLRYVGSSQGGLVGQRRLRLHADAATTAPVAVISDSNVYDGVVLSGSTDVSTAQAYPSLGWIAVGALADARTLTVSADEGWCTGGVFNGQFTGASQRAGKVLLNINFAGIKEPGGAGCGARHVMVMVGESKRAWPPSPSDAGYSFDAWKASVYPRWAYECRPQGASTSPTVPWNRDAGAAGAPYCTGGWCCVLAKVYRVPDGGL